MILMGRLTVILVFGLTWITIECGFAPALPSGRRTQYYYIYEDGAYKYGYDTGEGSYGKAVASPENEVQGDYAYQGPGGKVDVKYTAGKAGFEPDGFLPSHGGAQSTQYYDGHGSGSHHLAGQWVPAEDEEPGDASYSFSYNVGDQSRQEVSDQQGNIQGTYTFVDKDGSTRKVDYEAGAEKGFLITGITPDAGGSAPSAGISNPDGSYSFSYTAGDHSRHESTDANGNVVGSFSFIAKDDGLNRQVDYGAGAEKGFIASGNHLPQPVQPISDIEGGGPHSHAIATNRGTFQGAQAPATHGVSSNHHGARTGGASTVTAFQGSTYSGRTQTGRAYNAPTGSTGSAMLTGGALPGRAYEFSYDAGDHTRHESSDANGNVVGSFSFVAKDDNINRKVDYVSSAENGFQAFGAHLPVPPIDTNAPMYSGNQPQFHAAVPQHSHHTPSVYSGSGISPSPAPHGASGTYFSHGTSGSLTKTTHPAVVPSNSVYSSSAGGTVADISDGSYSFSYDAGDHTRQETSDGAGNVIGSFTFVAKDDGLQRKVDYTAAAERGFTASGNHLPLQPDTVAPVIASQTGPSSYDSSYHHDTSGDYNPQDDLDTGGPSDASYSFSYNAGDHTRQESSDAFGNVVGSFSFIAKDDGLNRQVDYESGAEKGFIARGSHLPSAFTYSATLPAAGHQYSGANIHGGAGSLPFQSSQAAGHAPAAYVGSKASSGLSNSYSDSKARVKTFLLPNDHHKFGYIYDTK